jgi:tryptophan synthase alpha subunit
MALTASIVYQPYVEGKRGALKAGVAMACRNPAEAERRAEKAMASGAIVGAQIVRVLADAEAGDFGDPEFLRSYGRVPERD